MRADGLPRAIARLLTANLPVATAAAIRLNKVEYSTTPPVLAISSATARTRQLGPAKDSTTTNPTRPLHFRLFPVPWRAPLPASEPYRLASRQGLGRNRIVHIWPLSSPSRTRSPCAFVRVLTRGHVGPCGRRPRAAPGAGTRDGQRVA
jgi:hypothetical protein